MTTQFTQTVRESEIIVERTVDYRAEINGYDVIFSENEHHGAKLSIYPIGADRLCLGIITCRPRTVAELEKFAEEAPALLQSIAAELRALGKDDLRSKSERRQDEMREMIRASASGGDRDVAP